MSNFTMRFKDVTHRYPGGDSAEEIFAKVNFDVSPGELIALRGSSGCGKTTCLLLAGGMLRPTAGQIEIDGTDLYSLNGHRRNQIRSQRIGYVFQSLELVPYLTVKDNLRLHDESTRNEMLDWLNRFELADKALRLPSQLSHGERQRIALIRAILHQPQIVLADEPTGNLDEENTKKVFEILRHFADSGGSVLVASHDPVVECFVDKVLEMNNRTVAFRSPIQPRLSYADTNASSNG